MKRRALGRSVALNTRMAVVFVLLLALYAGLVVLFLAVCSIGPGWTLGASIVTAALLLTAVLYWRGGGFYLRTAALPTHAPPPELVALVERLASLAELPAPRMLVGESEDANAFTFGLRPSRSSIVITAKLRRQLQPDELEAVIAHELAHIGNRDGAMMTLAAVPRTIGQLLISGRGAGDEMMFFWFFIWPLGLPVLFLGTLLTLAFSRAREYAADRGSAILTGKPQALMSALTKLSGPHAVPSGDLRAVEAFCIVPSSLRRFELFMDHPPLEKRLAALAEIARQMGRPVA